MSSNRLTYDQCAYMRTLQQSTDPLSYVMNPMKYENRNKCRMELGVVGGTAVSHIKGNLVDLENDLRGQTRPQSLCPDRLYQNPCPTATDLNQCKPKTIPFQRDFCSPPTTLNTELLHLPPCQMVRYKPVPLPPPMNRGTCPPAPATGVVPVMTCRGYNQ